MTDVATMPAGKDLDALVAERVLGWRRVQAPKYDCDGPLPQQGEVLVEPHFDAAGYEWPLRGVVAFTFFVAGERWSTDAAAAWRLLETVSRRRQVWFGISYQAHADHGMEHERCSVMIYPVGCLDAIAGVTAATMPLAVCRAVLALPEVQG